jgi:hypothetical protein
MRIAPVREAADAEQVAHERMAEVFARCCPRENHFDKWLPLRASYSQA